MTIRDRLKWWWMGCRWNRNSLMHPKHPCHKLFKETVAGINARIVEKMMAELDRETGVDIK